MLDCGVDRNKTHKGFEFTSLQVRHEVRKTGICNKSAHCSAIPKYERNIGE
jgi:hypothetical protein